MEQENNIPALLPQHEDRLLIELYTLKTSAQYIDVQKSWGMVGVNADLFNQDKQKRHGIAFAPISPTFEQLKKDNQPEHMPTVGTAFNKFVAYIMHLVTGNIGKTALKNGKPAEELNRKITFTVADYARITKQPRHRAREAVEESLKVLLDYGVLFPKKDGEIEALRIIEDYRTEGNRGRNGKTHVVIISNAFLTYLKESNTKPLAVPAELFAISDRVSSYAFPLGMLLLHDARNRGSNVKGAGKLKGATILKRLPFPAWNPEATKGRHFKEKYTAPMLKALDAVQDAGVLTDYKMLSDGMALDNSEAIALKREEYLKSCLKYSVVTAKDKS